MKQIAVDIVGVLVIGLVRAEAGLAGGHGYDSAGAINGRLPVAHLLAVVPDELVRTLLGVVHARQTVVIQVAEFRVGEVAVDAQRALQRAVDDARRRHMLIDAAHQLGVGHARAIKVQREPLAAVHARPLLAAQRLPREQVAVGAKQRAEAVARARVVHVAVGRVSLFHVRGGAAALALVAVELPMLVTIVQVVHVVGAVCREMPVQSKFACSVGH